jgi:diguanylate cyclase (GGDEF)-like protein/PAS domain S-box-containing protein
MGISPVLNTSIFKDGNIFMNSLLLQPERWLNFPRAVVSMVAATVLFAELAIMLLFATPFVSSRVSQDVLAVLDPLMLLAILSPVLYFLVFRRMSHQQAALMRNSEDIAIASIAFEVQEGIIVTDEKSIILRVNHSFMQITGYSADEAVGNTPSLLSSGRQSKDFYRVMWETLKREKYWEGELWNRRKNGEEYPEWLTITAVVGNDGTVNNYVGVFSDVAMLKKNEAEIQQLAFYDCLTKLPNRRLLIDRMQQAFATSERYHNHGAVLFLDLDNFKTLNDCHGHDIGDMMLVEVALRLQSCVRANDTVARLGGDEFVVMLDDLDANADWAVIQVKQVANKILQILNQPVILSQQQYICSTSIGIALFNQGVTVSSALKHADSAMYQAKAAGRNKMCFFDSEMQAMLEERAFVEVELNMALLRQQFRLYYQAQVDNSRRIISAEVLLRWIHPERGLIPPDQFIPLAEETGVILALGNWALEAACTQMKAWENEASTRDLRLSINVSARQFHQPDFVSQVRKILDSSGVNPEKIMLELTESMAIDDIESAASKIRELKKIGVSFSMDDFGTGPPLPISSICRSMSSRSTSTLCRMRPRITSMQHWFGRSLPLRIAWSWMWFPREWKQKNRWSFSRHPAAIRFKDICLVSRFRWKSLNDYSPGTRMTAGKSCLSRKTLFHNKEMGSRDVTMLQFHGDILQIKQRDSGVFLAAARDDCPFKVRSISLD